MYSLDFIFVILYFLYYYTIIFTIEIIGFDFIFTSVLPHELTWK